ncbi:MAG: RNA methyltransferase [Cyanobacteria bacterium J06632_22]
MVDLAHVRVILVEPEGPLNIGSAARVMKNFGLQQLVLVNPQCDAFGEQAQQMAVHAKELLFAAQRVDSLAAALVGCELAIATTARERDLSNPLSLPETEFPHLLDPRFTQTALVFGPESRGLNNDELCQAQRFVKVPTDAGYPSLNLAQAVAVCCYELARLKRGVTSRVATVPAVQTLPNALPNGATSGTPSSIPVGLSADSVTNPGPSLSPAERPASLDDLERYHAHLESVLLKIGYLYPHTAPSRMRKLRQLLHRTMPTTAELALLRGMLRQLEWALAQPIPNIETDIDPASRFRSDPS